MKLPSAPLASYGIKNGSKIMMIGDGSDVCKFPFGNFENFIRISNIISFSFCILTKPLIILFTFYLKLSESHPSSHDRKLSSNNTTTTTDATVNSSSSTQAPTTTAKSMNTSTSIPTLKSRITNTIHNITSTFSPLINQYSKDVTSFLQHHHHHNHHHQHQNQTHHYNHHHPSSSPSSPSTTTTVTTTRTNSLTEKELAKSFTRITEGLLQGLMKLDGFICGPNDEEERKLRKEGVRVLQGMLEQADSIKEKLQTELEGMSTRGRI